MPTGTLVIEKQSKNWPKVLGLNDIPGTRRNL